MRDTEREAETQAEVEAGSPLSREPNAGLDPRPPGSRPEPKADAQLLSHPGIPPVCFIFLRFNFFIHERLREREAETQAEAGAGSMQEAQCGT